MNSNLLRRLLPKSIEKLRLFLQQKTQSKREQTMQFRKFTPLLILIFALNAFAQKAQVISEKANLRGTPTAKGKVVDTLPESTVLEIIKQKGVWFLAQSTDYVGWIHGNTIRLVGKPLVSRLSATPIKPRKRTRSKKRTRRRSSAGRTYIRGSRGGCYYINQNGNKTYVSRSLCN